MKFEFPWLLLLLSAVPVVGVVWVWMFRRARERMALLIAPALQGKLVPPHTRGRFYAQFALVMAGLSLLVFAAARPQWGMKDEKVSVRGRNLVIALDVSRSMLAEDVHPNRLERAKADIMDLIGDLKGDRAALLAFRSKGILLCPLTTDYAFLRQALDGTGIDSAPRGATDLGDAIRKSLDALDASLDEYNAILLISDGEELQGDAVAAARLAAARNIPIFTVGIGDASGATIPNEDRKGNVQYKGQTVTTRLMDATLTAIAQASNGRYIPLGTAGTAQTTLGAIYRQHLRQVAAKEQQETQMSRLQERYQLFLFPALICLLVAAWFSRGRLSGSSVRKPLAAAVAAVLALVSVAVAEEDEETPPPEPERAEAATTTNAATNAPPVTVAPGREGARQAQGWLKAGKYREAAEGFLSAARGADVEEAETYRYNAGLAYVMAKDSEKAVQALRPLLLSKKNGARAGELLGKLLMERAKADGAEDPAQKVKALTEAAAGFQRALRDDPKDARRNRNFTRAVWPLPEAREAAHIAAVMKEHGQTPPDQLMGTMLAEQRALIESAYGMFTNDAPALVRTAEALAKRQDKQADLWIPLKQHMLQAVTNQQQQAQFAQQVELARDSMKGAAEALRDILPEAVSEVAQPEALVYNFWKAVAMPPALIDEDIICQSNAIKKLEARYLMNRDTQPVGLQLTQMFRERFPEWAQQYQQQAQADTNMPPFTAEDQKKIEELAEHAEKLQQEILDAKTPAQDRPALKEQALADLYEIRALLPKNPKQQQNQQQQNQQEQQQQEQQEQKQEEQEQNQDEQQQEEQQQEEQPQPQEEEKKEETPKDVQELLRRALEREKEHDDEQKKRMQKLPMLPSEQDW